MGTIHPHNDTLVVTLKDELKISPKVNGFAKE